MTEVLLAFGLGAIFGGASMLVLISMLNVSADDQNSSSTGD